VIRKAPRAFAIGIVVVGTAIFVLLQFIYGSQLANKAATIEVQQAQINAYGLIVAQQNDSLKTRAELLDKWSEQYDALRKEVDELRDQARNTLPPTDPNN
jgi:type VI protein secretion system component VasK